MSLRHRGAAALPAVMPALLTLFLLSGCGILGGGKEAPVGGIEKVATKEAETVKAGEEATKLILAGSDNLNDCGGAQANILVVRVYQLRSDGALVGASLSRLWDHEEHELGDDLLDQAEFVIEPGRQQEISISSKAGASVRSRSWATSAPPPASAGVGSVPGRASGPERS
ncbi:MAG: type VI secretion system lipoprotein TssJ [Candidatus Eisenbacteria bacterium]